jgi:hypothetical protein
VAPLALADVRPWSLPGVDDVLPVARASGGIGLILTGSQERVDYSYAAGAYSALALTSAREKRRSR